MKSALSLRTLALGLCLLAALQAALVQAAQLQSPPPLRLDAPEQERGPARAPAAIQPESAAAPALPPLSPKAATDQSAAPRLVTAQTAAPQAATGQGSPDQNAATAALPDLNIAWGGYFQALGLLCLLLAVLWALLYFFKRRGGLGGFMLSGSPVLRIESRLALGPKKWIIVTRYLDRRLVIGVTDQTISLLAEFRDEESANAPEKDAGAEGKSGLPDLSFAELIIRDKKGPEADAG
ncbi:flagellar biosynthetic protein FliO [Desulfovibrio sp. OttesenSCG-928-G11]|nr:flagellar biosynthetic protein FliO [Desulfovibrio sp. OttesenSCG-928-G11]